MTPGVDKNDFKISNQMLVALNGVKAKAASSKASKRSSSESDNQFTFETRDDKNRMVHLNVIPQ